MAPLLDDDITPFDRTDDHTKVFTFWPRRCELSNELLWFKKAWRVRSYDWGGHEDFWYCEREYLWKTLKYG